MTLLRFLRRYGIRDGWALWRFGRVLELDRRSALSLERRRPPWRRFHGERATMPGYRRVR